MKELVEYGTKIGARAPRFLKNSQFRSSKIVKFSDKIFQKLKKNFEWIKNPRSYFCMKYFFSKITLLSPLASQCMVVEELIMLQQQCGTNNWPLQFIPFFLEIFTYWSVTFLNLFFQNKKFYFIKILKVEFESLFAFSGHLKAYCMKIVIHYY